MADDRKKKYASPLDAMPQQSPLPAGQAAPPMPAQQGAPGGGVSAAPPLPPVQAPAGDYNAMLASTTGAAGGAGGVSPSAQGAAGFQAPPPGLFANYTPPAGAEGDGGGSWTPPPVAAPRTQGPAGPLSSREADANSLANFAQALGPSAGGARTPLDAPGGFNNMGAYLPGQQGNAAMEKLLQGATQSTSAADMQTQMRNLNLQRGVSYQRAPEGSLASFNAAGGHFTPESDQQLSERQVNTLFQLDKMASGNDRMNLDRFMGINSQALEGGKLAQTGQLAREDMQNKLALGAASHASAEKMAAAHNTTQIQVERMKLGALKNQAFDQWVHAQTVAGNPPTAAQQMAYMQMLNASREFGAQDRMGEGGTAPPIPNVTGLRTDGPAPPMPPGNGTVPTGTGRVPGGAPPPPGTMTPQQKLEDSAKRMQAVVGESEYKPITDHLDKGTFNAQAFAEMLANKDRVLKGGMPRVAKEVLSRSNMPREKLMEQIHKQLVTDAIESQGTKGLPEGGLNIGNFKIIPQLERGAGAGGILDRQNRGGVTDQPGFQITGPGGYQAVVPNGTKFLGSRFGGPGDFFPTTRESTMKQRNAQAQAMSKLVEALTGSQ